HTETSEQLRGDVPGSLRAAAVNVGATCYPAFGELLYSVRTGRPALDEVVGMPFFDHLAANPEAAEALDTVLAGLHPRADEALLEALDFSAVRTVVDVGGGSGRLLAAVLSRYPSVRGILFDRPHVVARAHSGSGWAAIADRCDAVGGDFFESVPPGGELYLLRYVIHDWDDARAVQILKNCRRAMTRWGRLLLVESVIESGNGPLHGKVSDLLMLAITGGCERTAPEYRALLRAGGFRLTRVGPLAAGVELIEAAPRRARPT